MHRQRLRRFFSAPHAAGAASRRHSSPGRCLLTDSRENCDGGGISDLSGWGLPLSSPKSRCRKPDRFVLMREEHSFADVGDVLDFVGM
ncbi:uncharacterized protein LOC125196581 isoform X2 [Salvia hispanica]|uniref:uncharacterized protein LOC125196581 isoform X2 n=1 Tax=Salvia hispanica TaxID=49212 RepID=UPI0020093309|nr:uncharacterized protein LOC125196581 isoform X2 [Salvia hispanica]